jgi:hypothetical protein
MALLQMQTILYHNSSGRDAFTGNLKHKEVHRAITLHPVKQHQHMYRVHNYMKVSKDFIVTGRNFFLKTMSIYNVTDVLLILSPSHSDLSIPAFKTPHSFIHCFVIHLFQALGLE